MVPKATIDQASLQLWTRLFLIPWTLLHVTTQNTGVFSKVLDRDGVVFDVSTGGKRSKGNYESRFSATLAAFLFHSLTSCARQNAKDRSSQRPYPPQSKGNYGLKHQRQELSADFSTSIS